MTTATREETKFIQRLLLFLVVPVIVYFVLLLHLSSKHDAVRALIDDTDRTIKHHMRAKKSIPTAQLLKQSQRLLEEQEALLTDLVTYATVPVIAPPDDVVEPGVYFKERLYMVRKKIQKMADERDIRTPKNVGFGEALPADKDVPLLLRKLQTLESIMPVILDAGVDAVTVVKVLDDRTFVDVTGEALPATEIGFRIDMNGSHEGLVAVLRGLSAIKAFVGVSSLGVKHIDEDVLEISVVCTRLVRDEA